jgi:hypothetical protein
MIGTLGWAVPILSLMVYLCDVARIRHSVGDGVPVSRLKVQCWYSIKLFTGNQRPADTAPGLRTGGSSVCSIWTYGLIVSPDSPSTYELQCVIPVGNIYFIGQRTPGFTVESPYFKKLYWLNVLFLLSSTVSNSCYTTRRYFYQDCIFLRTIPLLLTWIMRSSVRKCTLSRWRILRNTESRWRSCLRRFCPPPKKGGFVVYFVTPLPPGMFRFVILFRFSAPTD